MPKNTDVGRMYDAMVAEGMDKGKAARIAQARTGKSLHTGKAPKARVNLHVKYRRMRDEGPGGKE